MRITLVTETYFPQINGVSRTLGQLVRFLVDAGDQVQLLHPDYGEPPRGEDDALVRSVRVPFYRELRLPLPPFTGVCRAVEEFGPDLVHVATEATLGLALLRHAQRRGIPAVSSFHTRFDQYSPHYGLGWARGPIWRYLRWFHNQTVETYVPSRTTLAALARRGFERLAIWPRGVDTRLFRPGRPGRDDLRQALGIRAGEVVIAYVGRLAAEKNIEFLGAALEQVTAARCHARLLVVGDGPARAAIQSRLGKAAHFVGFRTGDDLADHFAAADLFAFASRTETFGNVVLEAMASGLPVVALQAGGPGEIVQPDRTGVLLPPTAAPDRMAAALLSLVDQPRLRRQMALAARRFALTQTWSAIMRGLRDRYRNAIELQAGVERSLSAR